MTAVFYLQHQPTDKETYSTSLHPIVVLQEAVGSPPNMGEWSPPSNTHPLCVTLTSKSSSQFMANWLVLLVHAVFWGIPFGSFPYCPPTHVLLFVLVFHFCRQRCLCLAMQTTACPSNTAGSSCWADPRYRGLQIWLKGLGYSLHMMEFIPAAPWWASCEGATALGHVPTHPCPSQAFGAPPLEASPPPQTCQGFLCSLGKWETLNLPFTFV